MGWHATLIATIGGAVSGPDAFYRVYPWTIAGTPDGRIYVLDVGEHRVSVFDSGGRFLERFGGPGGGPGEFQLPVGLAVLPDGEAWVADGRKHAVVRFAPSREVLPAIRLPPGDLVGAISVITGANRPPQAFLTAGRVLDPMGLRQIVSDGELRDVAVVHDTMTAAYPGCNIALNWLRPVFAPRLSWSAAGSRIAYALGTAYAIQVREADGRVRTVRRTVAAVTVSRGDALDHPDIRHGFTVRAPSQACRVSSEQMLERLGHVPTLSPIAALALMPEGTMLVRRRTTVEGTAFTTDVLDREGSLLGTLPDDFPFPVAFLRDDLYLTLVHDAVGVPLVRVYRLARE